MRSGEGTRGEKSSRAQQFSRNASTRLSSLLPSRHYLTRVHPPVMSSQKDTKPSSSKGTQQTLLSFFGKAPTSTPNASARPKPPSNATPSTSSTKPKPKSTPASSSSSSAIKPGGPSKTPLAARHLAPSNSNSGASTPAGSSTSGGALTSEGDDDDDGMDLDAVATGPSSDLPSSSSRKPVRFFFSLLL